MKKPLILILVFIFSLTLVRAENTTIRMDLNVTFNNGTVSIFTEDDILRNITCAPQNNRTESISLLRNITNDEFDNRLLSIVQSWYLSYHSLHHYSGPFFLH